MRWRLADEWISLDVPLSQDQVADAIAVPIRHTPAKRFPTT